jgi:MFS family permease
MPAQDYQITSAGVGMDSETYSKYVGVYYNIGYFPALMFVAPFMTRFSRKIVIGVSAIIWGGAIALQGYATGINFLLAMATIQGFFCASVEKVIFNIVGDFFAPSNRIRAYTAFNMIGTL